MLLLTIAQGLALTGGTVHTMVPGEEPVVATILVEDGLIREIGPAVALPVGYEEVDVTGLHLIPGLIDGAVNHDSDHDILYTAAGVTFVRDTGNDLSRILAEREPKARDRVPGPALHIAGLLVDGNPPSTTMAAVLSNPDEAGDKFVRLLTSTSPDYISIGGNLTEPIWRSVIAWAHAAQLKVCGPVPARVSLRDAVAAKQDGLLSLQAVLPPGKGWHQVEKAEELEAGIELLVSGETAVTPMVMVYARMLRDWGSEPEELLFLGPHYRQGWSGDLRTWRDQMQGELRALTERSIEFERGVVAALSKRGVTLVPGSGAPNSGLLPGRALVQELEQFEAAGIAPYAVLDMATRGAADALGVAEFRGTLEAAKIADIVALGLDPRKGLEALGELELVVVRGSLIERDELDARIARLVQVQAERFIKINAPVEVPAPELPQGEKILAGTTELRAEGVRINSEHFQVVKSSTGETHYGTRIYNQATATTAGTQVHLVQTFKDGKLSRFDMEVMGLGQEYLVKGRLIGGLMGVEVRANGAFVYSNSAQQPISLVDVGGALTAVVAAQRLSPKLDNFILGFEDLDPIVHRWRVRIAEDDHQFVIDGGIGYLWYGFKKNGSPAFGLRQQGNGQTELRIISIDTFGGAGLELPPERIFDEGSIAPHDTGADR